MDTPKFGPLLLDIPYTEMCFVEGGTFTMGDGSDKDNPSHEVTLSDFWIGRYPVTQSLYKAVMGNNPSHFKGNNHPVEEVSWFDAILFCNKISLKQGKTPCYYGDAQHERVINKITNFQEKLKFILMLKPMVTDSLPKPNGNMPQRAVKVKITIHFLVAMICTKSGGL